MDFKNIKVLVTDGGARQTLSIVRALKEIGCHVTVLCSSVLDVCNASKLPDVKIRHSDAAGSRDGFEEFLETELRTGKYDVLMPIAEMTTNKVTLHEDIYEKYAKIACAPRNAYIQAFNKQHTFEHAMEIGIPCPYTRKEGQSIEDYLSSATFPIIIKPRQGMGSIGFHKFENEKEFRSLLNSGKINIDKYVIQEFVHFKKRYGAYIFVDKHGNVATSLAVEVLRWYPIDAGTSVLNRAIDNQEMIKYSSDLLRKMKWTGLANVNFMIEEKTGTPKLLEINGRISAGVKMCWLCGFNIAKQLIELAYDKEVTQYPTNTKVGIMTRHSQSDFIWFMKSPDRFRFNPSWFSWKNTKDIVFSVDDPLPYFSYTLQRMFRYSEIMKKRKREI